MPEAPKPYKFCEAHFKKDCPICFGKPADVDALVQNTTKPAEAPSTEGVKQAPTAVTPPPVLSDAKAQKVVEAARRYAASVEAVAVITDQLKNAQELVDALKKKLAETKATAAAALAETKEI